MNLIIDIPEEVRVEITRIGLLRMPDDMVKIVDMAIQCGTPLPKGHGRLISAQDLIDDFGIAKAKKVNGDSTSYDEWLGYDIKKHIDNAPTIIAAESEVSDEADN